MPWRRLLAVSLVDVLAPERCLLCGREDHPLPPGRLVPDLRVWDRPHLCRGCYRGLRVEGPLHGDRAGCRVWAGAPTGARLVGLVSGWKYHGVRGAAWPLALLAGRAVALAGEHADGCALVPLPVHASRRRERGFDQAVLLARLLAAGGAGTVRTDVLTRTRATPQQAKLAADDAVRARNVSDAFAAPSPPCGAPPLLLVDDLVTTGATAAAAAALLRRRGWEVSGVVACGLALASA
ncbi:MAG TPA: hypothetical protein P5571_03010 [Candidatus Krumholzibacteria bacterium]|nr:hypothetical protein [Candidatus Krumholzibacteria bacterium]HRX50311.1 hypothetical protein [Candidatus Krumholzibacteria bacterium]